MTTAAFVTFLPAVAKSAEEAYMLRVARTARRPQ